MENYKIRITAQQGTSLDQDISLAGDYCAVRYGQRMAAPGDTLEVWRANECIFLSEDLGARKTG